MSGITSQGESVEGFPAFLFTHFISFFIMKKLFFLLSCLTIGMSTQAQDLNNDSVIIEKMLEMAPAYNPSAMTPNELFLYFARELKGTPYVAHTLDRTDDERLVINIRELDCTTYLENVLALTQCAKAGETTFADFKRHLCDIRYRQGELSYENRLHYYQWWVKDNEQMGFVKEIDGPKPPFTAVQTLKINYMSTHQDAYDMLRTHPERVAALKVIEDATNGTRVNYIPKEEIKNTALMRQTIHDGDILAIVTRKKDLDTTHLGIAVWKKDGLHLLNASMIYKKVVEDKTPLFDYMKQREHHIGIRVARIK